ncbi:MAG: helix-hairpin-helix domain-containing protein [Bacteroidales bacterium]|jgi:competence ComEA-like helix-hairpin-helix protein|nr:helix-hairpin-helix domain-containing protein [Bacteroidales bacterium]MDD5516908.1 helix-hairpin-helix domain-containing protein [Bacteroidales bacterium]HHV04555.1 hypothetical protein [Bacteroidales bacterium]
MKWGNKHHYILHATGVAGILVLLILKVICNDRSVGSNEVPRQIEEAFIQYGRNATVKAEPAIEDTVRKMGKEANDVYLPVPEKSKNPEPYIPHTSPRIELNTADSAELVKLYGIGPYYASRILHYREKLGGFAIPEQLLEVPGIDRERLEGFYDNIFTDTSFIRKMDIKTSGEDQLAGHIYIGKYLARCIIRYRETAGTDSCTLEHLVRDKILSKEQARKIGWYLH